MSPLTLHTLQRLHGPQRARALESLYLLCNHPSLRKNDPVSFVWRFHDPADREVAAWAASALAYGRVSSILSSLADLDRRWDHQPAAFVFQASLPEQSSALRGFRHRWTRDSHLLGLLDVWRIGGPSLRSALAGHPHYRSALAGALAPLRACASHDPGHLLPDPASSSACKRLAMWLRWMTRRDHIDPGLWADSLDPSRLWMPLDTHVFRIARALRLTRRRQPDAEAARRITAAFARIRPDDPLRYDFALTRLGMGLNSSTSGVDNPPPPA